MLAREESLPRTSPLAVIVPAVAILGLMTYFGVVLAGGDDPVALYQVGVLVGLLAYLLTFTNILLGISLLVAGIGLSPEFTLGGIPNLRLEDFIVPAIAAAWLTRSIRGRETAAPSGLRGPLLAFLGSLVLSTILGIAGGSTKPQIALLTLGKFLEYGLIFLVVAHNVKSEREAQALAIFSILIGLFSGLGDVVRITTTPVPQGGLNKVHGPLGETSTIFGGYLLLNLFLALGWYLHAPAAQSRTASAAAATLLGTALLYTYSRTTYAALAGGLTLFAIFKHRRALILILILLTSFPLLAPENIWRRAATISTVVSEEATPSWVARVEAWKSALARLTAEAPLTGFGAGATPLGNIDNEYVLRAFEGGFLGLATFLWILFRLGRRAGTLHEAHSEPVFPKGFAAGYLMGFIGMLIHAVGATSFTAIRTMEQFMLLSGLMTALANLKESRKTAEPPQETDEMIGPLMPDR